MIINQPLVTVITTCYNDGKFLHLPIKSVQKQTYPNYEHIVVNDGSTDRETLSILSQIMDPNVSVIHQVNKGLPGARNSGIGAAQGKYILPLDADDKITPDCLQRLVEEIEQHPDVDLVYSDYRLFGSKDRIIHTGQFNTYRILFSNYLPVCSLFRRRVWENVGGYTEEMGGFEDWEFWIKLVEHGSCFRKIDAILYMHHEHDANMWLKDKSKWKKLVEQIKSLHPDLYTNENIDRLRRENRITWLEDMIYHLPTPMRYKLRTNVLTRALVAIARATGLYRDK